MNTMYGISYVAAVIVKLLCLFVLDFIIYNNKKDDEEKRMTDKSQK